MRIKWGGGRKREIRVRIQGETAKCKGPLRGMMETKFSRSFLKYIHKCKQPKRDHQILGRQSTSWTPLSPNEAFSTSGRSHLIESLDKGVLWGPPPNNSGFSQDDRLLSTK